MGSVGEFVAVRVRGKAKPPTLDGSNHILFHALQALHALRAATDLDKRCDACVAGMFLAALRTALLFFEHHTLNDGLFPNTAPHDRQQYG
jgi:hypothetical protein